MKICFVGLGSIGKRHLENLVQILNKKNIEFQIDALRSKTSDVPKYISNSYFSIDDLPNDYDVIFITNPTFLHYETAKKLILNTKHMFIEKPVFDKLGYDISIFKDNPTYYIACPLRYSSVVSYLKEYLVGKDVFSARVICSTYLPDWRPNTDYRQTYSAKTELGGGVSIDLIHELDYISYLFGIPNEISNFKGKYSNLEISSDDLSLYILKYSNLLVSLHLDYFGKVPKREIEVYTKDDVILGDLIKNKITFQKDGKTIDFSELRNDYQLKEIENFLDIISGDKSNINTIEYANKILGLTMGEIL